MILSKYCKIYPYKDPPGSLLLFSTKKASTIVIPKSMLKDIKISNSSASPLADSNPPFPPLSKGGEGGFLEENLSDEEKNTLIELGFLVNDAEEEKKEMLHFMDEINSINNIFRAYVVMNLDCNLACKYCFEGTRKGKHYMTKETADEFVDFINSKIPLSPPFPKGDLRDNAATINRNIFPTLSEGDFPEETRNITKVSDSLYLSKKPFSPTLAKGNKIDFPTLTKGGEGGFLDEIKLVFYGGEPLLSIDLIIYISERLKSLAETKGIKYSFSFITNGTLLTRNTVEKLKPLGLKDASVTLDGPRHIHDQYRPFKTGKGSFDVIVRNLKDVCEMMDVQIGGNYTRENYPEFPGLLDFLKDNGLTPDKVSDARFDFVTNESEGIAPPDFHEGVMSLNEPWLFHANLFLREEILKRGYRVDRITPVSCMMEYKDRMIVNYDGSIYKCPGMIGREVFKVGDIRTGIKDYSISHNLDNWKNEECLNCAYLPLCFGGCRYMKLVRDGNMDGIDCKRPYFDATLETLVKQDIKYGLTAGE